MSEEQKYKTYAIEIKLIVKEADGYSAKTFANAEIKQVLTIPARNLREEVTKLVRQAVANMSLSAETGLKELIATEVVEIEAKKDEDINV